MNQPWIYKLLKGKISILSFPLHPAIPETREKKSYYSNLWYLHIIHWSFQAFLKFESIPPLFITCAYVLSSHFIWSQGWILYSDPRCLEHWFCVSKQAKLFYIQQKVSESHQHEVKPYAASKMSILFMLIGLSHVRLFGTSWAIVCQALLSMEFSSKNTRVGCHFLIQQIFLTQGLNPSLLSLLNWQMDSLPVCCLGSPYYS